MVPRAMAGVLGIYEDPNRPLLDTLADALRAKRLLLILDNCEHVIDACAQLVETILRRCPGVRVLASSREALGVGGELAWRVPSLPQAEAVQLFVERAALALPSFTLTEANAPAVQRICARLDGIPLAVELAAARVKTMSPERIAERLGDRFRLLTGGSRTALPRQQTLRGAIDWSYNLLPEPERMLLRRLAVFAGGWTLEAAEAVCADDVIDVLDLLSRVADKSLVAVDEAGRYRMLETIRQYAREKLADTEEGGTLRNRHLDYFTRLAEQAMPELERSTSATLDQVEAEIDNVRAALEWATETGRLEEGLRLAAALDAFWTTRGYMGEGLEWLHHLLALATPQPATPGRARAFLALCNLARRFEDRLAEAESAARQTLTLATSLGLQREMAWAYLWMADEYWRLKDVSAMRQYVDQALPIVEALADKPLVIASLSRMVGLAELEGDRGRSNELRRQALEVDPDNLFYNTGGHRWSGYVCLDQGDLNSASAHFRESLTANVRIKDRLGVAHCLSAFAGLALVTSDLRRAAHLLAATEMISETIHTPLFPGEQLRFRQQIAELGARLDDAALQVAWAEGRAMSMQQAIDLALALAEEEP
jgi:predicted ATPase